MLLLSTLTTPTDGQNKICTTPHISAAPIDGPITPSASSSHPFLSSKFSLSSLSPQYQPRRIHRSIPLRAYRSLVSIAPTTSNQDIIDKLSSNNQKDNNSSIDNNTNNYSHQQAYTVHFQSQSQLDPCRSSFTKSESAVVFPNNKGTQLNNNLSGYKKKIVSLHATQSKYSLQQNNVQHLLSPRVEPTPPCSPFILSTPRTRLSSDDFTQLRLKLQPSTTKLSSKQSLPLHFNFKDDIDKPLQSPIRTNTPNTSILRQSSMFSQQFHPLSIKTSQQQQQPLSSPRNITPASTPGLSPIKTIKRSQSIMINLEDRKQAILMKRLSAILPLQLKDINEKSLKSITQTIQFAMKNGQLSSGPKIAMHEFEIYALFRRILDRYPLIMRTKEDQKSMPYRLKTQSIEDMYGHVKKKVSQVSHALTEIEEKCLISKEKQSSKVLLNFFEGITYLIFVFFNTDSLGASISPPTSSPAISTALHSTTLLLLKTAPEKQFERLFHHNFRMYFSESDFNFLLEHLVAHDCDAILDRAASHLHNHYSKQLTGISDSVSTTLKNFFDEEQAMLYLKKRPQNFKEIFELQSPTFTKSARQIATTSVNPQSKLAGMVHSYANDLAQTVKRFAIKSPYHLEIDQNLKANLIKMYQAQALATISLVE